jgi:hypothetical protein
MPNRLPILTPKQIADLLESGMDLSSLMSGTSVNEKGIKYDSFMRGPSTNIVQVDYSGSSNIYSPYLYYNKSTNEKFQTDDNELDKYFTY